MAEFIAAGRSVPAGNGWLWIVDGWNLFKRQPGIWLVQMLIMYVMFVIPFLGLLVSIVLGPPLIAGLMIGCRVLDEGGSLKVEHLFAGFREHFGKLLAIGLLYLAAVVVISLVTGLIAGFHLFGLLAGGRSDPAALAGAALTILLALLVMLGLLVPVVMALWFAPALVVFNQQGPVAALCSSFAGCLRNIVPFLIYGVILLIPSIVATVPYMLGWLLLGPIVVGSTYKAYRDIYFS
jgi:hypothetical protein